MTPDTAPRFARIHVSPSPGTEEWPVVERVNGGWQSGGHHYPDSTVISVEPLHLIPSAPLAAPSDHLELDQVRAALAVLNVPVDEAAMGFAQLEPNRQITCLLALLAAWTSVFQITHEADRDPLEPSTMQMILTSSTTESAGYEAPAQMNVAGWYLQWAGMLAVQLGQGCVNEAISPVAPIVHLLRSAGALFQSWQEGHRSESQFTVGDSTFAFADGRIVENALAEAEKAAARIRAIIGETE